MAGVKAPWWKWNTAEYLAGVLALDLRAQGAWMRCISHAQMNGENPGFVTANLAWFAADFRESVEQVWGLLLLFALLRIGNVSVDRGEGWEVLDEGWMKAVGAHEKPALHWRMEVLCRRVKGDAERRERKMKEESERRQNGALCQPTSSTMGHCGGKVAPQSGIVLARVEQEQEQELFPPPPSMPTGGRTTQTKRGGKKTWGAPRKVVGRVAANTAMMVRIGGWFGRGPETKWSLDEAERLKRMAPAAAEVEALEAYYRSEHPEIKPYRRRQVVTLLNNWLEDVDKARSMLERYGDGRESAPVRRQESFEVV